MKIGVKSYGERQFLDALEPYADFFEIMAIEGKDYSFLKKYSLPIVIHAQHDKFGVNHSNRLLININLKSVNFAKNIAKQFESTKIILHPGELKEPSCSLEESKRFTTELKLDKILIENMPKRKGNFLCTTPEEVKEFIENTNTHFCFDINHAIETAVVLNKNPIEVIKEFLKLNPAHYHLGGQNIKEDRGHIDFKESDINVQEILKLLPQNAEISLEVTTDINKTKEDFRFIRELLSRNNL